MKVRIAHTKSNRGGARKQLLLQTSQQRALECLWDAHGGTTEVSLLTGFSAQALNNWRNRGKVPLVKVGVIAEVLDCDREILNFNDVSVYLQAELDWEKVIEDNFDDEDDIDYILAGDYPEDVECVI